MAKYYAVRLVVCNSGFGEWERSIYGGDYDRTIKGAIAKATAGDHDPERHGKYLLGRDDVADPELLDNLTPEGAPPAEDIRGLIHYEPERVYVVETMYGPQYVGVEEAGA
jgi:hypothetical protein